MAVYLSLGRTPSSSGHTLISPRGVPTLKPIHFCNRTLAWEDEKLNTALGSWAQLRHDTILYAKQPYIVSLVCSYPEAFVEPNPTFYYRMLRLIERT